ncbi:bacteriocin-like protein [Chryseobacterium sp. MEBOG07]|uniref:bacteriocin-like protein n=1 Tax=Chryseobacterium sp. MEBOG07 TaxID=2879939 RepID=UPI001F350519|nr:hypothetical protein [Chryseobacterium sp. MEBOG07]UKB81196.1 hypothetical protein LF886_09470 [Chryseobacterium sp. MEBOG07]
MKNFKKISRDQLKQVNGGGGRDGICKPQYIWVCEATGICGPESDAACNCYCIPIV